jgi:hypothetical protein
MHIWLDNEVFSWYGMPKKNRSFEIDYVRVWSQHKKSEDTCKSKRRCKNECCSGKYKKKKKHSCAAHFYNHKIERITSAILLVLIFN